MSNFKPAVETMNEPDKFYHNSLVFATKEEAEYSARDLMSRWMLVTSCRADETNDPVNYKIDLETGQMTAIP